MSLFQEMTSLKISSTPNNRQSSFELSPKLPPCHLAVDEGLPHVPRDQLESLQLPDSYLDRTFTRDSKYFLILLYEAPFDLPNTFQPLLKLK